MSQKSRGILILIGVFIVLVAVNLFFIAGSEDQNETEWNANRSTYSSTPFGVLAYYKLLEQDGLGVTRFTHPFTGLKDASNVGTLVYIQARAGDDPNIEEQDALFKWVEDGHLAIIIDRDVFVKMPGGVTASSKGPLASTLARPLQPTLYTRGVSKVQTTSFARRLEMTGGRITEHVGDAGGSILSDAAIGKGRVVVLTEPFVVSNKGIAELDNIAVALNLISQRPEGKIAFDEYHHGFGSSGGAKGGVLGYFAGTPIPWMLAQAGLLIVLVVFSFGRRFARPLPLKQERRTTNLEFVASMATITRLARATDLAMQNIYGEFRRRLCRYAGLPPRVDTPRLASSVARRSGGSERDLHKLLFRCEQVVQGKQTSDQELLSLVSQIREAEASLKF